MLEQFSFRQSSCKIKRNNDDDHDVINFFKLKKKGQKAKEHEIIQDFHRKRKQKFITKKIVSSKI